MVERLLGYKTLALISRVCKAWKHTPIILVFGRLRQEDREFKTSLDYIESSRAALDYIRPYIKEGGLGWAEVMRTKKKRKKEKGRERERTDQDQNPSFSPLQL